MILAKRSLLSRPQVRPAAPRPRRAVVVRASGQPTVDLSKKVESAVKDAEEACAKGNSQVRMKIVHTDTFAFLEPHTIIGRSATFR